MRIAIVGAGFTGLSAAYKLTKLGYKVFVFEKEEFPGGLAGGYKEPNWNWTLEKQLELEMVLMLEMVKLQVGKAKLMGEVESHRLFGCQTHKL